MSNIFIIIKCRKFVPEKIMCKISPYAIQYNFLWIGGNSIKNYHTHQYRGPSKYSKLFEQEINKVLHKSKLKHSVISGNKGYLEKPSEQDLSICPLNQQVPKKIKLKEEKTKINKHLLPVISKLKKTKYGYYLPISIKSIIHDHPYNVRHSIFISSDSKYFIIKGDSKHAIHITSLWLKRLSVLLNRFPKT
jgi:hypothetical protein